MTLKKMKGYMAFILVIVMSILYVSVDFDYVPGVDEVILDKCLN